MVYTTSTLSKLLCDRTYNKQVTAFVRRAGSDSWETLWSGFVCSVEKEQKAVENLRCNLPECRDKTCDVVFVVSDVSWVDRSL